MKKRVKIQLGIKNFYLPIISTLKQSTNLSKIQKKLDISKQQLTYYLRRLKKEGIIIQKGRGWYEVSKSSKNSTKYGNLLVKDFIRGHAYIWNVYFKKKIDNWDKRIDILKDKGINHKIVGALRTTPRIKVLGRKVWLCNNHLRIFDKKGNSYYGLNAIESRKYAMQELLLIIGALESKLGVSLRPFDFDWNREHYALIKNDLAIDQNNKGIIFRIKDKDGEWLLCDDSLEQGGELETIGKKSFETNIPMQKWWNDNKEHKFKVTPSFVMNTFNKIAETQVLDKENIKLHQKVLDDMSLTLKEIRDSLKELRK